MFTGITESLGVVEKVSLQGSAKIFSIFNPMRFADAGLGLSLSVNGACLTYLDINGSGNGERYKFKVSRETLEKSNLHLLKEGGAVNLERPLKVGARFEGHIVLGHVDTTVKFTGKNKRSGGEHIFRFSFEPEFSQYFVEKGSVALNGTSLTNFDLKGNGFSVVVLPHTLEKTNLKNIKNGDLVNCEFDVLGKYIKRILMHGGFEKKKSNIDRAFLAKHGF